MSFKTIIKIFIFFFTIVSFWQIFQSDVFAACDTYGCRSLGAANYCMGHTGTSCNLVGDTYIGLAPGPLADCGGCPDPSNPYCMYLEVWSLPCGTCCWGNGGGDGDDGEDCSDKTVTCPVPSDAICANERGELKKMKCNCPGTAGCKGDDSIDPNCADGGDKMCVEGNEDNCCSRAGDSTLGQCIRLDFGKWVDLESVFSKSNIKGTPDNCEGDLDVFAYYNDQWNHVGGNNLWGTGINCIDINQSTRYVDFCIDHGDDDHEFDWIKYTLTSGPCGPCIPAGCGHSASLPGKKFAGLSGNNNIKEVFLSNAEKKEKSFIGLVNSEKVLTEINLTETQKSPILKIQLVSASILEWFRKTFQFLVNLISNLFLNQIVQP